MRRAMNHMTWIRPVLWTLTVAVALCLCQGVARAEDEEAGGVEEKIKQQMEKILKLMRENEEALLKLSTGKAATPKGVDVNVPPGGSPPPSGSSGGGSEGSSGGSSGGASGGSSGGEGTGGDIRRKLEELIKRQQGSSIIPGELEKLVKMIPTRKGQGQGQGEPKDPSGKEPNDAETRDNRQKEQEQKEKENGGQDPQDPRNPRDPNDPMAKGKPEAEEKPESKDPEGGNYWDAQLPAEIRDAAAGGKLDVIPVQYRDLVRRYLLWLQKNAK